LTTLGAEGIEAVAGRTLLVEDQPALADAMNRPLAEPGLAARIGQSARQLAVERYVWSGAARALEGFCCWIWKPAREGSARDQIRVPRDKSF
jgi:hypothetical protein